MAFARRAGSPDLKMPETTKTPSTPIWIIRAAYAGAEVAHRQPAQAARLDHELIGRPDRFGVGHQFLFGHRLEPPDLAQDGSGMAHGFDDVAGAGLALGADHGRPLPDAAQGLSQVAAAANEGNGETLLVDVGGLMCRR